MKKILAIIMILIIALSCFASCGEGEKKTSNSQTNKNPVQNNSPEGDELDTLAGKTPEQMYNATISALKAMTEYNIVLKNISRVNFSDEPIVSEDSEEYLLSGGNAYIKYVSASGDAEEIWFVEDMIYSVTDEAKQKSKIDAKSFYSRYLFDISTTIFPLSADYFENVKFVKQESGYKLDFSITEEDYVKYYEAANLAKSPSYEICFDSKGNITSAKLAAVYAASNSVTIDFDYIIEFKEIGTASAVIAPTGTDSYRLAPSLDELDMSTIENLDSVTLSEEVTDYVMIDVNGYGKIVIRLFSDVAPKTVANFKKLVAQGFYDGLIFHRVIKDFMIQGGDSDGDGLSNIGDTKIEGEFNSNGFFNNLSHLRGVISMARTSTDNNSASTQFFIMHKDYDIDGEYASFGYVIYGMDVVDLIASVSVDEETDRPNTDVLINSIRFVNVD